MFLVCCSVMYKPIHKDYTIAFTDFSRLKTRRLSFGCS